MPIAVVKLVTPAELTGSPATPKLSDRRWWAPTVVVSARDFAPLMWLPRTPAFSLVHMISIEPASFPIALGFTGRDSVAAVVFLVVECI